MQNISQPDKTADYFDAQRAILTKSIDDIADEIGMALRDANLRFPVYITVQTVVIHWVSIATPLDPSDDDWERATSIACEVMGRRVGAEKLHSRELIYAVANAATISAGNWCLR